VTSKVAPHLTPRQVADLLRGADGSRYAALFALLLHTALRRGEALALQWPVVNLDKGTLRVRGTLSRIDGQLLVTEPKTAKSKRFVPISETAEQLLRRIRQPSRGEFAGRLGLAPDRLRVHYRVR